MIQVDQRGSIMARDKVIYTEELKATINERLDYNPKTGVLTWNGNWGGRAFKDQEAAKNSINHHLGRKTVGINGTAIRATYAIWVLVTGDWPKYVIDHIDGDPSNDKLVNLQDIPKSEDSFKKRKQSNNVSGFSNIHLKENGSYTVQVRKEGEFLINKTVKTLEEAIKIRDKVKGV